MAIQVIEDDFRDGVSFENHDESLTGPTRRFVTDVGNSLNLSFLNEVGDSNGKVVWVDLIREFTNNKTGSPVDFFRLDNSAHGDAAVAGSVSVLNSARSENLGAGREVRAFDAFKDGVEEFLTDNTWVGEVP